MVDVAKDLFSGTVGGACQLLVGHPFDTIKVKLQSQPTPPPGQPPKFAGAIDAVRQTLGSKGMKGLYRGMGPPLCTVACLKAVLFTVRGQTETLLKPEPGKSLKIYQQILSGASAGVAISFLACPNELMKCRLQAQSALADVGMSVKYKGPLDVASLPRYEQVKLKSRQGLQHIGMEEVDVKDPATMKSVAPDAKTMGEVMFRGNTVMNGYLKDLKATQDAFSGGWLRTGDLGVKHPDGYIELKDRLKDIIISGGENISTIEVESVIFRHPAVLEAAVVGRPDDHWGETPCAFVKLKEGCSSSAEEIIKFCRNHLPHYMAPRTVVFEDLPKTSTGKTQKFVLREKAKAMGSLSKKNISKL